MRAMSRQLAGASWTFPPTPRLMTDLQQPCTLHGWLVPIAGLPDMCKGTAIRLQSIQGHAHAAVMRIDCCVGAQQ